MHQERHHRPQMLILGIGSQYGVPINHLTLSDCLNRTLIPSNNLQSILSDWGGTGIIFVLVSQNIGGGGGGGGTFPVNLR